tara:strand:- start:6405 stop:8711 length:2307 start_codon:yes stop_codon:yes gene_type:complete
MLALHESESRLRAVFETAVDGIITIDSRGTIESVNHAVQTMFGHRAQDVIGKNVNMLMPHPQREEHDSYLEGYIQTGKAKVIGIGREVFGQRKDGTTFPLDLSVTEMDFGSGRRFTGVLRDITEKKRASEHLRRSDSVLRRAQELANIGSAQSTDPFGGTVAFWSDQAYRIYGREPSLGPPTAHEYLKEIVHDEDREAVAAEYEDAVLSARALDLEYRICRPDGSIRRVHNVSVPEYNTADEVNWTICYHDVTDQRDLEQDYRQAQKLEAVATLTNGIAHDYNNLLMGILGCTHLALKKLDADSPARMYLHEARNAAERGGALTRQLLTFSSRRESEPTQFDINEVIESAEHIVRSLVGEQIEVVFNLTNSEWRALGDRGHIEQVLMNLVVNARDAMPSGGKLRIETRYQHLEAKAARRLGIRAGDWLMLHIADSGRGMDAKTKERVFEPFFTTKGPTRGTGLGLATVYGIVKGFGGKIVVASKVGSGTTFTIYLPRTTLAAEEETEQVPVRRRSGTETILIVEDESLVRLTLRGYLEPLGYRILVACDVPEAILLLGNSEEQIELLITDMMLPGGTGRQVADELALSRPGTPVIWMSAHPPDILEEQGLLPADGTLLHKPFTEDDLLCEVDRQFENRGTRNAPSKLSILLVEDDHSARDAMQELLLDLAYSVVGAKDAKEAMHLATEHEAPIDVVVMDIGLPDGSGGELAAKLRKQHPNVAIVYVSGKSKNDPDVLRLLETSRTAFAQKPIDIGSLSGVIDALVGAS